MTVSFGNALNLVFRKRVKIYELNTQDCVTRAQGFTGSPGEEVVSSLYYSRDRRGGQEREHRARSCWAALMLLCLSMGRKDELKQQIEYHHLS